MLSKALSIMELYKKYFDGKIEGKREQEIEKSFQSDFIYIFSQKYVYRSRSGFDQSTIRTRYNLVRMYDFMFNLSG